MMISPLRRLSPLGSRGASWTPTNLTYAAIYNRFATKPAQDIAVVQETMVANLEAGGVIAKLDGLIIINVTEAQSVLNWIKDNHNLIKQLSTSFLTKRYFKGNSADGSYMEMDFNPSVDGVTFTNTEAHIGCYMPTNVQEDHTFLFGNSGGGTLIAPATGMIYRYGSWQGKINNGDGSFGEFFMPGRNAGYTVWQRKADTKLYGYFNGYPQSVSAVEITGTNLLNDELYALKNKSTGLNKSDNGFAVIHYGGLLTDADISLLYSELNTYLTYIGANESFGTAKLAELDFEEDTYLRKGFWQSQAGSPDFQYATSPISGTKSAYFPLAGTGKLWFPIYTGSIQMKFAIKFVDASPATNQDYLFIRNGVATSCSGLKLYTTGRTLLTSGGKTNYGTTVMADNTVYYMWFEYTKGTGANSSSRLYLNTVDVKPGTPECVIIDGSATANANNIYAYGVGSGMWMDDILITPL